MIKVIGIGDNVCDQYYPAKIMYPGGQAMNFSVYGKNAGGAVCVPRQFLERTEWQNTLFLFLMRSGSIIPDAGNMPARMDTQKSGLKMVTDSLS